MAETEFSPLPEELSPILDSLIDAVIILDTDGRIAGWNSVAEETFGWTMPQSLGQLLGAVIAAALKGFPGFADRVTAAGPEVPVTPGGVHYRMIAPAPDLPAADGAAP